MHVYDFESNGLLDEVTHLHCGVFLNIETRDWTVFVDMARYKEENVEGLLDTDIEFELKDFSELNKWLLTVPKGLICHNSISYDLPLLEQLSYIKNFSTKPDLIEDKKVEILDTLVMSQGLYPDRPLPEGCPNRVWCPVNKRSKMVTGHSLLAWGYKVANKKVAIDNWEFQPLFTYLIRCIEDVKINELTYHELVKERDDTSYDIDNTAAMESQHKLVYRLFRQQQVGCPFHVERAEGLVERCDTMMREIEGEVEPTLPERTLPASKQPKFPAKPFTSGGEISATGWAHLRKCGFELNEDALEKVKIPNNPFKKTGGLSVAGQKFMDEHQLGSEDELRDFILIAAEKNKIEPLEGEELQRALKIFEDNWCPTLTEPMKLGNQIDLKKWMVDEGWEPTVFGTKDITKDADKNQRSDSEIREKADEYIMKTLKDSPYRKFMAEILGVKYNGSVHDFTKAVLKNGRALPTSPKFKDDRGELCPDLERMQGSMAKQVVKWLSLRSRRTTLLPLDEKKTTGWLNDPRILEEGRITAGYFGFTNTIRLKHQGVRNVPKADPSILLGKEFRELFYALEGTLFQTLDAANMEALLAAAVAYPYDDGVLYDVASNGDGHQRNADAYTLKAGREVSRSESKGITYGILYGAQKGKVAKMLGISLDKAQEVIDAYWDTNEGLKKAKEYLEKYWKATGRRFIKAVDGRRIYTRSQHSLLNAYIQSSGAIMMNMAYCNAYDKIVEEGLIALSPLVLYYHDEMSNLVDKTIVDWYSFDTEDEARAFKIEGKVLSEPAHFPKSEKYWKFYSRTGEILQQSVELASEQLGLPFKLTGEYALGLSWADTH
jgi:hypothetical protein